MTMIGRAHGSLSCGQVGEKFSNFPNLSLYVPQANVDIFSVRYFSFQMCCS
jgi:hypothetical protein